MPELYPDPVEGPYTVPSGTDIADGPQAFRDFADSLGGLSDTLEIVEIAGDHTATAVEMGSLFTYSGLDSPTLTIDAGLAPVGSVFAVANLSDAADSAITVETPNLTEAVGQYAITSFTQVAVDKWIPNGGSGGGGGGAYGTPGPVTITEQGDSVIKFTAGDEGEAGPTLAFGATVEPNSNGEQVLVEADPAVGGDVIVNNTQLNTDYVVTIYGVNLAGLGEPVSTESFQVNYNIATGGGETIEDGYNGTNQKWKVHRMPRGGQNAVRETTFTVIQSPVPFRVLIVGSGGQASNPCGSGGGGGAVYHSDTEELDRGDYICKVPGGSLKQTENQTGLPAEAFGHKANGGGTSPGGGGNVSSTITGKAEIFGRGNYSNCQTASGNGHGGKVQTSDCSNGAWGCAGNGGDVIVAYQSVSVPLGKSKRRGSAGQRNRRRTKLACAREPCEPRWTMFSLLRLK